MKYVLTIKKDKDELFCSRRQEFKSFMGLSVVLDFSDDQDEAVSFKSKKEAWFLYYRACEGKSWKYDGWKPQVLERSN